MSTFDHFAQRDYLETNIQTQDEVDDSAAINLIDEYDNNEPASEGTPVRITRSKAKEIAAKELEPNDTSTTTKGATDPEEKSTVESTAESDQRGLDLLRRNKNKIPRTVGPKKVIGKESFGVFGLDPFKSRGSARPGTRGIVHSSRKRTAAVQKEDEERRAAAQDLTETLQWEPASTADQQAELELNMERERLAALARREQRKQMADLDAQLGIEPRKAMDQKHRRRSGGQPVQVQHNEMEQSAEAGTQQLLRRLLDSVNKIEERSVANELSLNKLESKKRRAKAKKKEQVRLAGFAMDRVPSSDEGAGAGKSADDESSDDPEQGAIRRQAMDILDRDNPSWRLQGDDHAHKALAARVKRIKKNKRRMAKGLFGDFSSDTLSRANEAAFGVRFKRRELVLMQLAKNHKPLFALLTSQNEGIKTADIKIPIRSTNWLNVTCHMLIDYAVRLNLEQTSMTHKEAFETVLKMTHLILDLQLQYPASVLEDLIVVWGPRVQGATTLKQPVKNLERSIEEVTRTAVPNKGWAREREPKLRAQPKKLRSQPIQQPIKRHKGGKGNKGAAQESYGPARSRAGIHAGRFNDPNDVMFTPRDWCGWFIHASCRDGARCDRRHDSNWSAEDMRNAKERASNGARQRQ